MHGIKEIIKEAESLPIEERAVLVDSLLRTLNPPDSKIDSEWIKAAKRRLEDLRTGQVKAVLGDIVFDKSRKRFGK